jgi:hypothetical protein
LTPYLAFASSPWNVDISAAPADAHSADIIAWMKADASQLNLNLSGVNGTGAWGTPIYWAATTDIAYNVRPSDGGNCGKLPPEFASVRIPNGAKPSIDTDAHMVVFDAAAGMVYSFWRAAVTQSPTPSVVTDSTIWTTCQGAVYYLASNGLAGSLPESNEARNQGHRGLAPSVFAVRKDETDFGTIAHALRMLVNTTKAAHVFPMSGDEGGTTATYAPPEGTRVRIKASVDLAARGLAGAALVVGTALKTYGAVIGDQNSGPPSIMVENGVAETGSNIWAGVLTPTSLKAITLDDFEVVQLGYGA